MIKSLILISAIALTGCSSVAKPYVTIGAGYKINEMDFIRKFSDNNRGVNNSPISARIEFGVDECFAHNVSCGFTHRSQWLVGFPFNDDTEYDVNEFFVDYTYRFGR